MRLIINADDLGMSEEVNDSIFACMNKGFVTSATTLGNGPAVDGALKAARHFPLCSFGVHLNLTQFRPLTDGDGLRPFLNEAGEFHHSPLRPALRHLVTRAIGAEWCAQTARVKSHAIDPSHFDSHHHVHLHPYLFAALGCAQREHGIRRLRRGKNIGSAGFNSDRQNLPNVILAVQRELWRAAIQTTAGARTPHGFTSLLEFYQMHRAGAFDSKLWRSAREHWIVELMVHPGHPSYAEETHILESGWLDEIGLPRIAYREV
jgi:chitin disaccharide deacetylase